MPVLREATRRRFCDAPRHVILGDGAPWISSIAQELFPDAIQIVDRFHVQQTLHRTAQAIFDSTSQQGEQWATARCVELDEGKLHAIVNALRPHVAVSAETRPNAYSTSIAIADACGIRSSANRVFVPPCAL